MTAVVELSVIIPTFNRVQRLRACLDALCAQTQPFANVEVIVVVDGSTDGTCEMLSQLNPPYSLRIIEQSNQGQCAALNRGVEVAQGRYLLFLDDDIIATRELLSEHLRTQIETGGVVGVGQLGMRVPACADWFARCFARGWNEHYNSLNHDTRNLTYEDCYSGNMSVPAAAFMAVGGFAQDLTRRYDIELAYRLKEYGLSLVYIQQAKGIEDERKSLRELIADTEEGGKASVEISRRHPATSPQLLGTFITTRTRERLFYRLLLTMDIPARVLAKFGSILPQRSYAYTWYRFVRRYAYWRGVRRALPDRDIWCRLTRGTPILMYHAFGTSLEAPSRYVLPERQFVRQMSWLKWLGYRVISLEEYLLYRHEYSLPPRRSVVITIDDGYADNWSIAFPILSRYRFPATIFIINNQIGGTYYIEVPSELNGRSMLSWPEVEALRRAGIEFGAHTRTHPDLTRISSAQAEAEIAGSKQDLERRLDTPIRVFSYPFGEYSVHVQNQAEQAGFLGSCSVNPGLNTPMTPLHALRRVEIRGTDSLVDFALAVRFGKHRQNLMKSLKVKVLRLVKGWFRPLSDAEEAGFL